jgi:hypothetical protein
VNPVHSATANPQNLLGRFAGELVDARHGLRVQAHRARAVTLGLLLNPQKYLGIDRLRAGVATPLTPCHGGKQEQRKAEITRIPVR